MVIIVAVCMIDLFNTFMAINIKAILNICKVLALVDKNYVMACKHHRLELKLRGQQTQHLLALDELAKKWRYTAS